MIVGVKGDPIPVVSAGVIMKHDATAIWRNNGVSKKAAEDTFHIIAFQTAKTRRAWITGYFFIP